MAVMQKLLSSWHKLILNGEVETAFKQLESEITENKWTTEQENQMANYCLVATNMRAYELIKLNVKDPPTAQQIFLMTNFCCCIIEKTWKCKVADFLGSIRVISQYFLASNNVYEALVIGQYSIEFVDQRNEHELSKDENALTKSLLLLYLHHLNKVPISNLETILDIWKFILSPQALETKSSNFSSILMFFGNFCSKANTPECLESSLLMMSYLSKMPFINFTDKDLDTFMNICEILIRYSKTDQLKNNISKMICCIEHIKSSCRSDQLLVLQFCCDVLCFSICSCDSSASSILVDKCAEGLNSIMSVVPILRIRAVNLVRVVLINAQNSWIDGENFFYRKCLPNLFEFFTKLSETVKSIEMSQNNTSENKYFTVSNLALLIIHRVQGLCSTDLGGIYSYVKKCLRILLEVYDDGCKIDKDQKTQLYNNIGAHSFNVCCFYMKAKLYSECEELSLMVNQKIAALPNDLVQSASLQTYIEKIGICLYQSCKYENALRTMCIWAIKLPHSRNTFMNRFGTFKAKIFYDNQNSNIELVNKTCWDWIKEDQQKKHPLWEKINFNHRDVLVLLKLELKQCLTQQIYSVDLVEKIVNQGMKQNDNAKIELSILAGLIFTQSNDSLNNAMKLLPLVEKSIEELNQKLAKETRKEKIIRYVSTLGCLQYVKFRIQLLNARCINEEEIRITGSIKPAPSEPGMEQETRDDSDVIHKYLTYKSQQEFINYLDTAIDCWSRAINEASDKMDLRLLENCSKICEEMNIQSLIQETALMYRLYCAESKEIPAWKLLYSLAVIREDNEMTVYAFSNLVSLNAQVDPEWETEVQEKLANVEKITQIRYRLETIRKLFINGRGPEGVAVLSQISETDVESNVLLAAKYHFLISQYTLAGFYNITDYPMSTAVRAFYLLIPCIKKNSWRYLWEACEIQSLLLDVSLFIVQFFVAAFQTSIIKPYLNKAVYLIKKLGLPLRICKVLTTLCTVGVITCKTEDIHVKLDALQSVLKFNDGIKKENYDKRAPVKTAATLSPPDFASSTDVRFVSNFDDNYTSPVLKSGLKFDMPEFVDHELQCGCVMCDDVHYQQISCQVMSLFGSYFCLLENNHHGLALRYFKDALEMSTKLRDRWMNVDPTKGDGFLKSQIVTKMHLGDFWASNGDMEKSGNFNNEAQQEYENLIVRDEALRAQLTDQYLALEYIRLSAGIKQDLPKKKTARQKLRIGVGKTPANKTTLTVFQDDKEPSRISELMKNMAITPLPRHSRRLLFKDDDSDFFKPMGSSRTARIRNKKEDTPPDIVMQTPSAIRATSKRIFEDKVAPSTVFQDDDLFTTPALPATSRTSRIKSKKEENTLPDVVVRTPSKTRLKKILDSKVSSIAIKIDDDLLTGSSKPTTSSRTTRIKSKKDNCTPLPLDIIKQTAANRARVKKITEQKTTSSVEPSSRLRIRKN